jgi:hypothetical protein
MGLDAYTWLAYRLHALKKPTPVHWARLHQQFGSGFKTVRQFKVRIPVILNVESVRS